MLGFAISPGEFLLRSTNLRLTLARISHARSAAQNAAVLMVSLLCVPCCGWVRNGLWLKPRAPLGHISYAGVPPWLAGGLLARAS